MNSIIKTIGIVILALIIIAASIGAWWIGRKINYTFQYESNVKVTINERLCEVIKPSAMTDEFKHDCGLPQEKR